MGRSLSFATLRILSAMLQDPAGAHYGLAIIDATGVKAGTLYPALRRLEEMQWIVGEWEDIDESAEGRRRRRYYRLTPDGVALATAAVVGAQQQLTVPAKVLRRLGEAMS